jgi:hypothetical protein
MKVIILAILADRLRAGSDQARELPGWPRSKGATRIHYVTEGVCARYDEVYDHRANH